MSDIKPCETHHFGIDNQHLRQIRGKSMVSTRDGSVPQLLNMNYTNIFKTIVVFHGIYSGFNRIYGGFIGIYSSFIGIYSVFNGIYKLYKLVGGIPTPLKNMSSSVGMMTFPIYGKIIQMFQTRKPAYTKHTLYKTLQTVELLIPVVINLE